MTVLFVLDKLDMGGLQKVNVFIANELSKHLKVSIYSLQKYESNFELNIPIFYGEKNFFNHVIILIFKFINYVYKKIKKETLSLVIDYQIKELLRVVEKNRISALVLSGPSIVFAHKIKKRNPNIKCVLWMHNTHEVYFTDYFFYEKKLFLESVKTSDGIVCLTNSDRKEYLKYSKKAFTINNPITINNPKVGSLNSKNISFVGSLKMKQKGLDYLAEISKRIPADWTINVVGVGNDQENLLKLVDDRVLLKGQLKDEKLNEHYLNSSIHISTSRWEGFGLVITEAMSFGLPIVSFNTAGGNEILDNGKYGIITQIGDIDTFCKQLNKLIVSKELRQAYSKKSYERSKDFKIEKIILKWVQLLKKDIYE